MSIGSFKLVSSPKINKYIVGFCQHTAVINLIQSRNSLIFQIKPVCKKINLTKNIQSDTNVFFGTQLFSLMKTTNVCAQYSGKKASVTKWIPGTFSRDQNPEILITAQGDAIIKEANINLALIIGLINTDYRPLQQIAYPIFGNTKNIMLCKFFFLLLSRLIVEMERKFLFFVEIQKPQISLKKKLKSYVISQRHIAKNNKCIIKYRKNKKSGLLIRSLVNTQRNKKRIIL